MVGNAEKVRLTSDQKKKNHIESEKKRREAIRIGFEQLSLIVPGCEGQSRSESFVLSGTVTYLLKLLSQKEQLKKEALKKGMSEAQFEKIHANASRAAGEAYEKEGKLFLPKDAAGTAEAKKS